MGIYSVWVIAGNYAKIMSETEVVTYFVNIHVLGLKFSLFDSVFPIEPE